MRYIRFRVWDKVKRIYCDNYDFYIDGYGFIYEDERGFCGDFESRKPHLFIVEQYTGLKDKNGKEIYEGDILLGLGHVEYDYKRARFSLNISDCLDEVTFSELSEDELDIIGNVLENPGLIKKELIND